MAIQNIDPANNPLAIKVDLDTAINGIKYDQGETYNVTGPVFAGGAPQQARNLGMDVVTTLLTATQDNVKVLQINDIYFYMTIHYPSPTSRS